MGSMAIYNSGISSELVSTLANHERLRRRSLLNLSLNSRIGICIDPADMSRFTWDISGLPVGKYDVEFRAYDKAGCSVGDDRWFLISLMEPFRTVWLPVSGTDGKIVGVSYADESVQFQYKQTGDWIPIGIGRSRRLRTSRSTTPTTDGRTTVSTLLIGLLLMVPTS